MTQPLQLLIAEDNAADAELLIRALRRSNFEPDWRRVDTEKDFVGALHDGLDLIISDYDMPHFTGLKALTLAKARYPELPFLIVSGTIGEETAVEAMRLGATDYLLKDRLVRLGPAVERALQEARSKRERRLVEEDFRLLFAHNPMPMWVYELDTLRFLAVNDAAVAHYGYSRMEFLSMTLKEIRPAEDVPRMLESVRGRLPGVTRAGIWRHLRKDGSTIMVEIAAHITTFQGQPAELVLAHDVTERFAAEEALCESEGRLRIVTENARVGLIMVDTDRRYTFANATYAEILGLPSADIVGLRVADVLPGLYEEQIRPRLDRAFAGERVAYELNRPASGGMQYFAVKYEPTKTSGQVSLVVVVMTDITERVRADQRIREQLAELLRWQDVMLDREDRVQTLKAEINALLAQLAQPPRYGTDTPAAS